MTTPLDLEAHVAPPAAPLWPGALGALQALAHNMAAHGAPHDLQDLASITSVAFACYAFDPDENPQDEVPRLRDDAAILFTNYGVFESLGYATGWEVREFNFLTPQDYWRLAHFELSEGRVAATMWRTLPLRPAALCGVRQRGRARQLQLLRALASAPDEVELTGQLNAQGECEDFVNWIAVARPDVKPAWAPSIGKLRANVLRWAVQHSATYKEFFHETRVNYAPGMRAFAVTQALLEGRLADAALPSDALALTLARLHDSLIHLREARAAAAASLPVWADAIGDFPDAPCADPDACAAHLRRAALSYGALASALGAALPDAPLTLDALPALARAHAEAARCEALAMQSLASAVSLLPLHL